MSYSLSITDIQQARAALSPFLPTTPCTYSQSLSNLSGHDVYVKWDLKYPTGSFKERGALNFLLQLNDQEKKAGICAASAGNHALAVSAHAQRLGIPCHIIMPLRAPLVKVETTKQFGATVELFGDSFDQAYLHAQQLAHSLGAQHIPGFDHEYIIAGQGTAALEIFEQCPGPIDCLYVPVGGGGLAAGISLASHSLSPATKIIGVRSEWATYNKPDHYQSPFRPATIADGIAVKQVGTLPRLILEDHLCREKIVTEREIANAIMLYLAQEKTVVEGAGAAALAGFLADLSLLEAQSPKGRKKVVLMACGSNIDLNVLSRLIDRAQLQEQRLLRIKVSVPDRPGSLSLLAQKISSVGANVLETFHDRRGSDEPSSVDIVFLLEVRNGEHKQEVLNTLESLNLQPGEI